MPLVDPSTGEEYGMRRSPTSTTSTTLTPQRPRRSPTARTTPSHRQEALLGFADDVEKAAEELLATEDKGTGEPV